MKKIKLKGRIGNQMFIYACAKALERHFGEKIYFVRSNDEFSIESMLNVQMDFVEETIFEKIFDKIFLKLPRKLKNILIKLKMTNKVFESKENCYCSELFKIKGNAYYEGYYQTEKYFEDFEEELRKDFTFKPIKDENLIKTINKIKSANNPVFINIRRGDYVALKENNVVDWLCSMSYYQNATKYIAERIPDATFFAISDEPEWIRENLTIDYPFEIVSSSVPNYDICLLAACKHAIVANSSYSWWGAWLINNPQKIVCAPTPWFEPEKEVEVICKDWVTFSRFDGVS